MYEDPLPTGMFTLS